jgi:hypothetical protein
MSVPLIERRGEPRVSGGALPIAQATLRPGCPVRVVDLSSMGAQVQCERPLRPGSRVFVRFVSDQQLFGAAATVLRCSVWALDPESITYRGALRFEERCPPWREAPAHDGYSIRDSPP